MTLIQFLIFVVSLYRCSKHFKLETYKIKYINKGTKREKQEGTMADNAEKDKKIIPL